jgi:hypothetical protein
MTLNVAVVVDDVDDVVFDVDALDPVRRRGSSTWLAPEIERNSGSHVLSLGELTALYASLNPCPNISSWLSSTKEGS